MWATHWVISGWALDLVPVVVLGLPVGQGGTGIGVGHHPGPGAGAGQPVASALGHGGGGVRIDPVGAGHDALGPLERGAIAALGVPQGGTAPHVGGVDALSLGKDKTELT